MRVLFIVCAVLLTLAAPVFVYAQPREVVSARAEAVEVTVYPPLYGMGLAMISETRTVDLPAGPVRLRFRGVVDQIVAQTVAVEGLPDTVAEQNFDYQLLTPGSLIAQSEGRTITLVRTNPENGQVTQERARVISGANGALLDIGGRIEALKCSAMPERLVFDDLPPGFFTEPTLSVDFVSPRAQRVELTLSYLATGISWEANYVARIRPDGESLDLQGWMTIRNGTETMFPNAPIQVIAGQLQRRPGETQPVQVSPMPFNDNCWQIDSGRYVEMQKAMDDMAYAGAINFRGNYEVMALIPAPAAPPPPPPPAPPPPPEDLGDYKLYRLAEPTTLAARQTKQLLMLERQNVRFTRLQRRDVYSTNGAGYIESDRTPFASETILELDNEEEAGLGLALPQGRIATFVPTPHGPMLLGEPRIRDTPEGVPFDLPFSTNPLIQTQMRVVAASDRSASIEVTITNASPTPAIAQIREVGGATGLRVSEESRPHLMEDGMVTWRVPTPANGSVTLTYTLAWDR